MKIKIVDSESDAVTVGSIYEVLKVDDDGDYIIRDNDFEEFIVFKWEADQV